jgi:hypothetical protein
MILFLNKSDLFEEKIVSCDIRDAEKGWFLDYEGGCNMGEGKMYFEMKFLDQNMNAEKEVYVHTTCATNTENVAIVFNSCKDIILRQNLESSGFI